MVYETAGFSQPAAPDIFKPDMHEGRLLLIWPTGIETGIQTDYGASDAVRCSSVVVLDGPAAGTDEASFDEALIFPSVLRNTLRPSIGTGKPVLGRLEKGTAKPGKSAPWLLKPFTAEDAQLASNYIAGNAGNAAVSVEKSAPASNTAAQQSFPTEVPADKAALAKQLAEAGTDITLIKTATGLDNDQLQSIGVLV